MIEYEVPFVCLIFTIMISIVFFAKEKIELEENSYFKKILIFTLLVNTTNFISHYFASIYLKNGIDNWYSSVFALINKLGSLFLIIITINLVSYVFYISFNKYKENIKLFRILNNILTIVIGILIFILKFNVYKIGGVTSGNGSAVILTFSIIFFNLILCLIVSLLNIKKYDKRYNSIYIIIILIIFLGVFVMFHPEFNIYDLILCLLCYLMYFTIENPDVKMINELEYAKNTAEKANRAKTDFLSSMSHEIRTPLNAVVGFSECIKTAQSLEEAQENADDIIMASQNLLEIVNGILDISKIEADKMEIVNTEYNPNKIFNDLIKMIETRIGEKNIELRTEFAPDIPEVLYGDRGKVQQIITNVLTNAVKYTEKGYIDFKVSCVNNNDNCRLSIVVKDTGRGIKPEKIKTLFNKFERLEEDKNTTIEGTGLGLAITKSLAEMMGGKVVVQSDYGIGSTFTIYIPQKIVHNSVFKAIEEKEETITTYSNSKVLVVDDNTLNLKVANKVLSNFDLEIELIDNGFECINKIENHEHYDIILMDIMMPKMSGVETLKKLKQIDNFNIPVVALTADAMEGVSNKYIEVGFNDYLRKPIEKEELKRVLNKFLANKENSNKEVENTSSNIVDNKAYVGKITDDDIKMLDELLAKSKIDK